MAHWGDIQDAIVTKLQSVSTVKNVKKDKQRITDTAAFDDAFTVAGENDATARRVHTWIVSYGGVTPITSSGVVELTTYHSRYKFDIDGYLNFMQDGTSEHILRDIVDDILLVFIPSKSLGLNASATTPIIGSDITVDNFDVTEFGPVICSHVKMTVYATVWHGNVQYT